MPILLVGDDTSNSFSRLNTLLNIKKLNPLFEISTSTYQELNSRDLSKYSLILLDNLKDMTSYTTSLLKRYLDKGKSLFIILGDNLSIKNFNKNLVGKLKIPRIMNISQNNETSFSSLNIPKSNDLFKDVFNNNFNLGSVEINKFYMFNLSNINNNKKYYSYKSIIETHDNNRYPILFELDSKKNKSKILVLTTSLKKEFSNIAENGIILPIFNNSLRHLIIDKTDNSNTNSNNNLYYTAKEVLNVSKLIYSHSSFQKQDLENYSIDIVSPKNIRNKVFGNKTILLPSNEIGFFNLSFNNENEKIKVNDNIIIPVNSVKENLYKKNDTFFSKLSFLLNNKGNSYIYSNTDEEFEENLSIFSNTKSYSMNILYILFLLLLAEIIMARKK